MSLRYRYMKVLSQANFWLGVGFTGSLMILAVLGSFLFPYSNEVFLHQRLLGPTFSNPFGFDLYGRDLLSSCALGAKVSLYIALSTVTISLLIGTTWGCVAGYFGGFLDSILMRIVDVFMSLPSFLLSLAVASLLGPSLNNIIFAIAITGWTGFARISRGEVLAARRQLYVEASRSIGAAHLRILTVHLLPAILPPLLITATFSLSGVIIVEASLSFLGLASGDSLPTWGRLLSQGKAHIFEAPHLSVIPGVLIMFGVLGFNFLGDAFKDAALGTNR